MGTTGAGDERRAWGTELAPERPAPAVGTIEVEPMADALRAACGCRRRDYARPVTARALVRRGIWRGYTEGWDTEGRTTYMEE